ncbi:MAG: HlyC/CorC family transporter [Wenzhouxiangella sp.]|nr:MAG: HlyC/CorC family transporter [Wenzhouxiangella sp.]
MTELSLATLFILLAVLIILSAFFSSSETGLVALNRYRLRHQAQSGHRGARLAQNLLAQPDRMFGLILLGNNLVNILAASIATVIALRLLGEAGIWVSTLILTGVILIFAELAPKTVAALHPQRIAYPASYVLTPLLKLLYPVVWLINLLANTLLRAVGISKASVQADALNRDELRTLVQEGGRHISLDHQQMLINILDLEHGTVDDVMVPRQDIVGIDMDNDWEDILQTLTQSIYTRMPVWRGSLENIVGLLHIRTVLTKLAQNRLDPEALLKATRRPYFIPEGTPLTQQLLEFQGRERRMGMVVDEYGDIQGLVTLDDILEEIVGEYTSEGAGRQRLLRKQENGSWLVDGSTTLRMLNRRLKWDLPTAGAKTVNGLILEQLESLPDGRTSLRIGDLIFTIVDIADNRIRKVRVWEPDDASEA